MDKGLFKTKTYNRTHLSEVFQLFDDIAKIRKEDSQIILVGNGKLIKHTGSLDNPEVQALIGKAIQKKALFFKYKDLSNSA